MIAQLVALGLFAAEPESFGEVSVPAERTAVMAKVQSTGVAADVVVSDCYIRAKGDGSKTQYKVQKDNADEPWRVTITDATLEGGQANDVGQFRLERVLSRNSQFDNFKLGSTAGAARPMWIGSCWAEHCGEQVGAHGDGAQGSTNGHTRVVATGFLSTPVPASSGPSKYTGPYPGSSYGLTNSMRIDASGAPKLCEEIHFLGVFSCFGSLYPICIAAQQTDSITRNITVAHCVLAPAAFRYDGNAGDAVQIHPSLTDFADGGGLIENVGFIGNEVFGFGPLQYADRGAPSLDVTGIWHWKPSTLDPRTRALWQDAGLLTAGGLPAPGMLRSVAGVIAAQPKTVSTTGAFSLNLDLSAVPDDATITLHLADVPGLYELEYIA